MTKITLYHGTNEKIVTPTFGLGDDRHDYGKGFYLTEDIELAKEWAVCRPDETNGWVHKYELYVEDLKIELLEELLSLGDLGIQYCIKSEKAYSNLHEIKNSLCLVDYAEFNDKYNKRDSAARKRMKELVDSDANKVTNVFSTLIER